ncbi:MAG: zinc ribbon domain-containing protein [Neomegalonema sp.]|nr:zinc ribbon domain-containing protein [Neomegalonema sp.]
MPVYEYWCDDCGPFEAMASIARYADPQPCPSCAAQAARVMMTAPRLAVLSSEKRRAHETNERSADSPKRSGHGPGCSCCGGGNDAKKGKSGTLYRPDGSKSFPAKRPWMISH